MNARTLNLSAWLPASTVVGHGACCSSCAKNKPCESTCVGNVPGDHRPSWAHMGHWPSPQRPTYGVPIPGGAKGAPTPPAPPGHHVQVGVPLYSYGNPHQHAHVHAHRVGGIEEPRSDTKKVVLEVLAAVLAAVITVRVLGGKP